MFNLNKKLVSKEGLLVYIKDIDVYRFYSGEEVVLYSSKLSPLRDEDTNSFGYFLGKSGEICFNDFVLGKGDFVRFVEFKFGLTFFEALSKIATDFNLLHYFECKKMPKSTIKQNIENYKNRDKVLKAVNINKLQVRTRDWAVYDLIYWKQFGITKQTLDYYNVKPIDYIFFNSEQPPVKADKYAYVFYEFKDKETTMKIYQPFSKSFKWLNNHNDSIWQGWTQLPKDGKKLIITKSLKDVMSIVSVLNIPSVSLQSESVTPKQHILEELNDRFEEVYLLYDNDFEKEINIGKLLGYKIVKEQPIIQLNIPDTFKCKDFSDLTKKYGKEKAHEIYETCIEMPF